MSSVGYPSVVDVNEYEKIERREIKVTVVRIVSNNNQLHPLDIDRQDMNEDDVRTNTAVRTLACVYLFVLHQYHIHTNREQERERETETQCRNLFIYNQFSV